MGLAFFFFSFLLFFFLFSSFSFFFFFSPFFFFFSFVLSFSFAVFYIFLFIFYLFFRGGWDCLLGFIKIFLFIYRKEAKFIELTGGELLSSDWRRCVELLASESPASHKRSSNRTRGKGLHLNIHRRMES